MRAEPSWCGKTGLGLEFNSGQPRAKSTAYYTTRTEWEICENDDEDRHDLCEEGKKKKRRTGGNKSDTAESGEREGVRDEREPYERHCAKERKATENRERDFTASFQYLWVSAGQLHWFLAMGG